MDLLPLLDQGISLTDLVGLTGLRWPAGFILTDRRVVLFGLSALGALTVQGGRSTHRALGLGGVASAAIAALVILLAPSAINWRVYPRFARVAGVVAWQAGALWLGRANLTYALFEVSFAIVVVATHFAGWYLALPLALLAGDGWRIARVVALTFTATLTTPLWAYLWSLAQPDRSLEDLHLIVVPLVFVPLPRPPRAVGELPR